MVLAGDVGIDHDDQLAGADQPDRREILARVVADVAVERRIDRERAGAAEHQRVAVGRGLRHRARGDRAAGAGAVLDDDVLAERLAHLLGDDARHHVVAAAGGVRHHQRDRPGRIILRRCRGRDGERTASESSKISWRVSRGLPHSLVVLDARRLDDRRPFGCPRGRCTAACSSGVVGIGSAPSWASRRFTSSVASASRSTLLSLSTIGRGVPAGATMP